MNAQGTSCATGTLLTPNNCSSLNVNIAHSANTVCSKDRTGWFTYTPTVTQSYTFTIKITSFGLLGDPAIYIGTTCPAIGGTCYDVLTGSNETVTVTLTAGTTYYIGAAMVGDRTFTFELFDPMVTPCTVGSCVTKANSTIIFADIGANCQYIVPDLIAAHGWTATAMCGCWNRNAFFQIPLPGLIIDAPGGATCSNADIDVIIRTVYSHTDLAGITTNCTLDNTDVFTRRDIEVPTILCPAMVTLDVDPITCQIPLASITALFTGGNVADNCTDDATLLSNIELVSTTAPGVGPFATCPLPNPDCYNYVFRTKDACDNYSADCSFTVCARDVTPPTIICPADRTINYDATCMATLYQWAPVSYEDNCSNVPYAYRYKIVSSTNTAVVPVTGLNLEVSQVVNAMGICPSNVTVTIRVCAQDCFGNGDLHEGAGDLAVTSNCCTYDVTLQDNTMPTITAGCSVIPTDLNVGAQCTAVMPDLTGLLTVMDNCSAVADITIYQIPSAGSVLNDGLDHVLPVLPMDACAAAIAADIPVDDAVVSCGLLGQPLKDVLVSFVVVDCNGNCSVYPSCRIIRLLDVAPPTTLDCPAAIPEIFLAFDPASCAFTTATLPVDFFNGLAIAGDNCDPDPIEHNNSRVFNCLELGLHSIPIWGEDCNGNTSGILGTCQVRVSKDETTANWTPPAMLCVPDQCLNDAQLIALIDNPAYICGRWSGDYITEPSPGEYAFCPPGNGTFSVTYTLGQNSCDVSVTHLIHVGQTFSAPYLINDFSICWCPEQILDLNSLFLPGIPTGGTLTVSTAGGIIFNQIGGASSRLYKYVENCGEITVEYTYTDCTGAVQNDEIVITVKRCPVLSFSPPDHFCQDESPYAITDALSTTLGCDDYNITFWATGPDGNDLLGGAAVTGTLADFRANILLVTINPKVEAGDYMLFASISDPDGVCATIQHEESLKIYKSPKTPNSIIAVGPLCENATFPVVLTLQNPFDAIDNALVDADVRWYGTGVTDNGVTANFSPADLDGDGTPGPGLFTVCVSVGDPRCEKSYCRDILINNDLPATANDLVTPGKLCSTPGYFLAFDGLRGASNMPGGTFTPMIVAGGTLTGLILPNGFLYTGGCGQLKVTYTLSNDCDPDMIDNMVNVDFCQKIDVEITGSNSLCVFDLPTTITSNITTILPVCGQTGTWTVMPATAALVGATDGTATFDPKISGEGTFLVSYILNTSSFPASPCADTAVLRINVGASSEAAFVALQKYCVTETAVNLAITTPDPSIQEGSPNGKQEIWWFASCGACLTVNPDSTTAIFNPSAAGPGVFSICVTTGSASCMKNYCTVVEVVPQCVATLVTDGTYGCFQSSQFRSSSFGPRLLFDLSLLYLPTTTRGGTWSIISNPPNTPGPNSIQNETLLGGPGCYTLRYTSTCSPCSPVMDDINIQITEKPTPVFDLAEEVCWDGIAASVVLPTYYQGTTWGTNALTRLYNWSISTISGAGPAPTLSSGVGTFQAINNPTVTINGAGTFEICVTERLTYAPCVTFLVGSCTTTYCERIVVHQTTTVADPTWTPAGPFCVDQACIDLDARITGTTGGVFTGVGVQLDPSHPNYRFCPAVAGAGTHTVCYTVQNGAGCTAVMCHNIVVNPAVTLACPDTRDTLQCATKPLGPNNNNYGPYNNTLLVSRYTLGTHNLNALLCPTATRGGSWSFVTGPTASAGAVAGDLLYFTNPGCYTVRYTVSSYAGATGACTATQDFTIHVGEVPMPMFDLPDNVCWDLVTSVTFNIPTTFLTSPTYTGTVVRNYRSTNAAVATVNAAGLVTIAGAGTTSICMEEVITTIACGVVTTCTAEVCEVLRVQNNTTVVNPAWTDPGPICIDQACVDLTALITGTTGGIFTGKGVQLNTVHPNYCFNPATAGVGIHAITYTVVSPDGCSATLTRNVVVYAATNANLVNDLGRGCFKFNKSGGGPFVDFNLQELWTPTTTPGGTWTIVSGTGTIRNYTLSAQPGCHTIIYTVPAAFPGAIGACASKFDEVNLLLGEEPEPDFDVAEEACWNGIPGSLIIPTFYNGLNSGINATVTYDWSVTTVSGAGPVPTFSDATAKNPTLIIQGPGVFEVCITETNTYAACGSYPAGAYCSQNHCERITIHQSNTEVNPNWTPAGPFCVDQACIDLDFRITGTTGGVFSGVGVQLDPSHPNYRFCPAVAGVGTHTVCYTVQNGAGCTAVLCHNIVVNPAVSLACADTRDTLQCATKPLGQNTNNYGPYNGTLLVSRYTLGTHSLNALLCPTATRGGTWSFVSGPAAATGAVSDGLLYFTNPGCYTVRYTVSSFTGATGTCTATQDFTIHVGEMPMPMFDLPDNVCWDLVTSVTYNIPTSFLTSPTYTGTVARNYRSTNPAVASVTSAGVVTVAGVGTTTICMEEIITTIACGVTTTCTAEVCEVLRVQNNTTVVNPAWTAFGPLCIDQACVRLDLLVTGTANGIFTGHGVRPTTAGHPQYEFCPALAGVGTHVVTYTVNSPDGCTAVLSRNITVYPAANATLVSDSIVCQLEPTGIIDLTALFTNVTTGGGVFTKTGGPATGRVVGGNQFNYTEAGCYCFSYTVSTFPGAPTGGACIATGTACLLITEQPQPNFDIQNERCWNITDPIALKRDTLKLNNFPYDPAGSLTRSLRVMSGPATVIANGPVVFAVEYTGAGTVMLCMTETLTYAACGAGIPAGRFCTAEFCKQVSVQDGTAQDAGFTIVGAKAEYCPGDTITLIPNVPGGIFSGTNVGNSSPVGTNGGVRFTGCGIYDVTYTVESPAGCENSMTRTFFTDRTNPVFAGPFAATSFDTIVECDGTDQTARMNAWAARFAFTDNCQVRSSFRVYDRRSGCSLSTGLYIFEITGSDTCGNSTKVYPSYRVQDVTPPSFTTLPSNITITCDGSGNVGTLEGWLNTNGGAIATDACSRVRITNNFPIIRPVDWCNRSFVVTFTATDECNNFITANATVTYNDNIAPTWEVLPQDKTLECANGYLEGTPEFISWYNTAGYAEAEDNCSSTITYERLPVSNVFPCSGEFGRTQIVTYDFTAIDQCNNRSTTIRRSFNFVDVTGPIVQSPAKDTVVYCQPGIDNLAQRNEWLLALGRAVFYDECEQRTIPAVTNLPNPPATTHIDTIIRLMRRIEGCSPGVYTETWMFQTRDGCDNLSPATIADFIVRDTMRPVFTNTYALDSAVNCDRSGNPVDLSNWLARRTNPLENLLPDVCDGTTRIEHDLVRHYDLCSNTDSMVYRFTAYDCSGNSSTREAVFKIQDITPPLIDPLSGTNKITSCDQSNAGNDDEILAWLDSMGGLRATDMCSDVINWRHTFSELLWVTDCGDTRHQDVTFFAIDDCGNTSSRTLRIATVDTTKPVFLNCPRPPIVIAAETFHCDAYVNFEWPLATDNCSVPIVTQIDKKGLTSGDRFPVGTTILVFEARDLCGNRDTCTLKIIVNDYWDVPVIACKAAVTMNTAVDSCGLTIPANLISPDTLYDNCPKHLVLIHTVKDQTGSVIKKGFGPVSNFFFPKGVNTIEYCAHDQCLLQITEVTQEIDGGLIGESQRFAAPYGFLTNPTYLPAADLINGDFIELTNYGPCVIDLACLSVDILGIGGCSYTLPPKYPLMSMNFLAPGRTALLHVGAGRDSVNSASGILYFNMNCTQTTISAPRGYVLRLNDRIIDVVATNGFNPVGTAVGVSPYTTTITANDWIGATPTFVCEGSLYRKDFCDLDLSTDWKLASSCDSATLGRINKGHPFMASNGDTSSIQSIVPNVSCCKQTVNVLDQTNPQCGKYDTTRLNATNNINVSFGRGSCFRSTINVTTACTVGDICIANLTGSASAAGGGLAGWNVTLISPKGTRVKLWQNVCPAATAFNLNLCEDNCMGTVVPSITTAPCVPNFGNGGTFKPMETFDKFFNENSIGVWTLEIEDNSCTAGTATNLLSSWQLQILCKSVLNPRDTMITADFKQCRKLYKFNHPTIYDNCPMGTIDFTYSTVCTVARTGESSVVLGPITKKVSPGMCDSLILPIGVTTFSYVITDMSGNTGVCSYTVTVKDVNAPMVTCNKDITINADPGDCGKFYNFTVWAMDSCGLDTVYSNPVNGFFFPIGTTRTCVYAIDKSGNIDSCCFNVEVKPYIPNSSELSCNDLINLSLDANCQAVLNADHLLEGGNHWCYADYEIIVTDYNNVLHPNLFTHADIGLCFKVTIRDRRSGNSCWGKVCIEDKQQPVITCPRDTIISCIASIDPSNFVRPSLNSCEDAGVTWNYHDDIIDSTECSVFVSIIERTWTATDNQGNSTSCKQKIFIRKLELADVRFPRNYDDLDLPHLECSDVRTDKDISAHLIAPGNVDWECVDGYLLDSAVFKARIAIGADPRYYIQDPFNFGARSPRVLGWNYLESGRYAGNPSPYNVYYNQHPQWDPNRACWPGDRHIMWRGTGFPTIDGYDISNRGKCAISIKYDDDVYAICEDGYEVLRYWKIRNMCLPVIAGVNPIEHIQIIKVIDKKGPKIVYPDSITVTSSPWECNGIWSVTEPWLEDVCSDSVTYSVRTWAGTVQLLPDGHWVVRNLPVGFHRAEIVAKDNCGNTTIKKLVLNVIDGVPPIAICRRGTIVSLSNNQSTGEGIAKLYASDVNEGSFDNCSPHVYFKIIRMEELLDGRDRPTRNGVLPPYDNIRSCNGLNGDDHPGSGAPGNQVYFDDFTKFCCADIGKTIMVVLRVSDKDPGDGPIHPNTWTNISLQEGHFNDCMVEVQVQDKQPPTIVAPPDMVVSCWFWFDPSKAALEDPNNETFGKIVTDLTLRRKVVTKDIVCHRYCEKNIHDYPGGTPGLPINSREAYDVACDFYYGLFDTAHWDRKYELVWGQDGYALSTCAVAPEIDARNNIHCGQGSITRTFGFGTAWRNITASQTIYIVDCDPFWISGVCFDILDDITWGPNECSVIPTIEGCGTRDWSPDNPILGRPKVVNGADDNCALIAIEYEDERFTIEPDACLKIIRKWTVIDWCQYDPTDLCWNGLGRWEYTELIKIADIQAPVVSCGAPDCSGQGLATIDPRTGLCVNHITLTASAYDSCSPIDWLKWEYKIDIWNDGKGIHGGYDYRVGSLTQKERAAGDTALVNHNDYADDRFNPFDASGSYPLGVHKIKWFVEDGCGNVGVCETLFEVKDCKKPTPYCLTGIITVPMPSSGCIEVWAKDLNLGSSDNCTPKDKLLIYFNGDRTATSKTICCEDFLAAGAGDELIVNVEMWVEDEEGNTDFCKTQLIIQDVNDICPNNTNLGKITGNIKTLKSEENKPVDMQLFKNGQMIKETKASPYYFLDLGMQVEYLVKPTRNDDFLNGVTTADIVKIQKHILGQELITNPYLMIAADVNNSKTITAADLSEIRKLILGVIPEFKSVPSWTFIPTKYVFPQPSEPWTAPRSATVMLNENLKVLDFISVKLGDINESARSNFNSKAESRNSSKSLNFEIKDIDLIEGETYKVNFKSSNFNEIVGCQFTLKFDQDVITYQSFESNELLVTESNFGLNKVSEGILTLSWNSNTGLSFDPNSELFTLEFKANKNAKLSQVLEINDRVTQAEAYNNDLNAFSVKLNVGTESIFTDFELFQNAPNPFKKETEISFSLPKAIESTLTVYDQYGKVLRIYEIKGVKGLNKLLINKEELNGGNAVLYYQLDAADYTATKRMVLVD